MQVINSVGIYEIVLSNLFKKILRENSTVRETEDMARQVKAEVEKREPRTRHDRLWIPELDEMAKEMEKTCQLNKVSVFQSRSLSRIVITIKGDVEVTTPKIKEIHKILTQQNS